MRNTLSGAGLLVIVCGFVGYVVGWDAEVQALTDHEKAAARGGTFCTISYVLEECDECVDRRKCDPDTLYSCKSYVGDLCLECFTDPGDICPGTMVKFFDDDCFFNDGVFYPECEGRFMNDAHEMPCEGACA